MIQSRDEDTFWTFLSNEELLDAAGHLQLVEAYFAGEVDEFDFIWRFLRSMAFQKGLLSGVEDRFADLASQANSRYFDPGWDHGTIRDSEIAWKQHPDVVKVVTSDNLFERFVEEPHGLAPRRTASFGGKRVTVERFRLTPEGTKGVAIAWPDENEAADPLAVAPTFVQRAIVPVDKLSEWREEHFIGIMSLSNNLVGIEGWREDVLLIEDHVTSKITQVPHSSLELFDVDVWPFEPTDPEFHRIWSQWGPPDIMRIEPPGPDHPKRKKAKR